MKKLLTLALPCLLLSATAHADWTGLYAGANIGYAWNSSTLKTEVSEQGSYFASSSPAAIDAVGTKDATSSNFLGGAGMGYHWQSDVLVIGFDFDVDVNGTDTSHNVTSGYPCCSPSTFTIKQNIETSWLSTLRPHVGVAYANFLAYATGGLAISDLRTTTEFSDDFGSNAYEKSTHSSIKAGWTAGAGVEYAFNSSWSVGAQYLYTSFGNISSRGTLADDTGTTAELKHDADLSSNILRLSINCHFG